MTAALGDVAPEGQSRGRAALDYRAKAFIDARLYGDDLSTESAAAAVGISPRYLQDIFHAEATTVSAWIWARQLDKAQRDHRDPPLAGGSISPVAQSAGFVDLAHFSQHFPAAYGMTQRDFRRSRGSGASATPKEPGPESPWPAH
jgi:AraC-like DNA-binding protein